MCGIAGIFFKNKKVPSFGDLKKMSKLIQSRGPDDVGFFKKPSIVWNTGNEPHFKYGNGPNPKEVIVYKMSNNT